MKELYQDLKAVWQKTARENRLSALKAKAIEKGFRAPEKTAKVKKTAKGNKLTKNQIFLSIIQDNPGISMAKATGLFFNQTGSVDKHYNLVNDLVRSGVLRKGPAKDPAAKYGIYFA